MSEITYDRKARGCAVPKTWMCPFWCWEDHLKLHCDGAALGFKSPQARQEYIGRYCANNPGWEGCPIAKALVKECEGSEVDEKTGE